MKICLTCKGEYLEHMEICGICNVVLVSEEQALLASGEDDPLTAEEFFESEVLPFIEGGISRCREVEKILAAAKVSCIVYPVDMKAAGGDMATLGSAGDKKYMLLVRVDDLELAKTAMDGQFHREVSREGTGALNTETIDLSADAILCPACGETGPLSEGECATCGLFLGVNEIEPQKVS